jgi:hypothetical protein
MEKGFDNGSTIRVTGKFLMTSEPEYRFDDKPSSLIQPDTVVAHEYFDSFRRKTLWLPEKELMFAILEDAVGCFQNYLFARDKKGKQLFLDAETWINGEENKSVLSFDNVCEELDLDPEFLRSGLRRWKQKKLAEATAAEKERRESKRARKHYGEKEHRGVNRSVSTSQAARARLRRRAAPKN